MTKNKAWSTEEKSRAKELLLQGKTYPQIAAELGRTAIGVQSRLRALPNMPYSVRHRGPRRG